LSKKRRKKCPLSPKLEKDRDRSLSLKGKGGGFLTVERLGKKSTALSPAGEEFPSGKKRRKTTD